MPGRPRGAHSYSDAVSLNIVDAMLPCNSLAWDGVAEEYQRRTGEPKKREGKDIKKHFIVKLCRSGKKPTGISELTKIEAAAQAIYKRILDREHAASYGAEDDGPLREEVDEEESEMTSQHSSQHEGLWDTDETSMFINSTTLDLEESPPSSTPPATAAVGIAVTPQNTRKRPLPAVSNDTKSKNCRNSRSSNAATALSSLATTIAENASNSMVFALLQ